MLFLTEFKFLFYWLDTHGHGQQWSLMSYTSISKPMHGMKNENNTGDDFHELTFNIENMVFNLNSLCISTLTNNIWFRDPEISNCNSR